jgi:membrane protein required for colicin V production
MQTTDIILLIPLLWGLFWGFYKGVISQLTALIGICIALYVSIKYYAPLAHLITPHLESNVSKTYVSIAAFAILFIGMLVLIFFLSKQVEKLTKALHIGSLNHIAGGLFGLIKWAFILSVVISLISKCNQEFNYTLINFHNTWVYNHIKMILPALLRTV